MVWFTVSLSVTDIGRSMNALGFSFFLFEGVAAI